MILYKKSSVDAAVDNPYAVAHDAVEQAFPHRFFRKSKFLH
jgi:hypothetical protein